MKAVCSYGSRHEKTIKKIDNRFIYDKLNETAKSL